MQQAQLEECRVWIDEFGYAVYVFKTSQSDECNEVLDTHTRLFSYTLFSSHLVQSNFSPLTPPHLPGHAGHDAKGDYANHP